MADRKTTGGVGMVVVSVVTTDVESTFALLQGVC
jgi:hypothetical protein